MATAFDVPADKLIPRLAEELKKIETIKPPEWAAYVKTGRHKEKSPVQEDWWYIRSAAVLRKIYIDGPMGSTRLAACYGGYADRGAKPDKAVRGSRSIARSTIQLLEKSQLIQKERDGGRKISPMGQKLVDSVSTVVLKELAAKNPELTKYL
ncbi:MAG: 30S ribosomal protein S19e [Thermoplasmata archaeon]|nr:30S ribosomal protein S19e [Thermoplasmata archaeon]MBU1157902.1 30S ribosomal protein S19e [Candidatus Thermoplasmatota archaeon]MCJ7561556.1 30S ribosomal protein S19e [Thermoplasmata archaeon]TFG69889.1 MAG: 30S ribosomal protein S19e [Methanomassiliicoccus sp.]